ncbi:sugar ABC transporter permease [Thalassobacter stenotrophicus]|jgi:glucose/mannose transport system permease protein|uniref:Lactose transport system permease protein LacF n=2 Tax=Thalassobacter stenotrophicus TaxID=266809 RepID=A0A0P1F1J4_9RHOB|nr:MULTISPECIES: sugar ABC transporter permease [Thalassobacter]KGK78717.1 ABC transporter permease [Thalassobacter stenotrophicus]KGL00809.1 ABC transporter permease [Thalassobacter sp. 16PALIMAR09]PVZ48572.1 sugar ABC transporter permease [Thalassobacter stenotrophicus]UYP68395.1 sugar ABC transporter permease [Thalassobacter stenotrophicus]CUH61392.1 Lactose transport system permease protein LacF [Thalassobacter stenotrophicus]
MTKWLEEHMPKLVLAPSFIVVLIFVYGFIAWTAWVSLTRSRLLPRYEIDGFIQYDRLFASPRWDTAFTNLFVFGFLFIVIAMILGLILAILLDQNIRTEGAIRTIYLYPMALSMIVTGTAWKWILNPGLGLEATVRGWGFEDFTFNWLVDPDMAIYTVVIAAIWQSSGFVMALFLAGLRSVDQEIIKAAQVDGIPTWRVYTAIIIPAMAPIFLSAFIVLSHLAIKSFDLVIALTGGGPGYATDLPATYMYTMAFSRGDIGQAASSAMIMMMVVFTIVVPYLYSELRTKDD